MSEYSFSIEATISMYITVKASSLEAAIAAAQNAGVMSLCHQCARGEADEWSTSGGLDCDPSASPLVDVTVDGEEDAIALAKAQEVWS